MTPDKKSIMEAIGILLDSGVKSEGEEFCVHDRAVYKYMIIIRNTSTESFSIFAENYTTKERALEMKRAKEKSCKYTEYTVVKVNKIYGEVINE